MLFQILKIYKGQLSFIMLMGKLPLGINLVSAMGNSDSEQEKVCFSFINRVISHWLIVLSVFYIWFDVQCFKCTFVPKVVRRKKMSFMKIF